MSDLTTTERADQIAAGARALNEAMRQWSASVQDAMSRFAALAAALRVEGDPDEPLWFDAMRPDPDAEVWNP